MTLWFVFALMTGAAVLAVLWPLGRFRAVRASGSDVAVYQDQLNEITRDRAEGLIGGAEAEAARVEISRRLIAAADAAAAAPLAPGPDWRRRSVALLTIACLPVLALGLYAWLGSPGLPGMPLAGRLGGSAENESVESLVAQIESHLDRKPEDGRGWEVLAPVYLRLGRLDDAVKARRNALRLLGDTAAREAELGEALTAAAGGVVTDEAKAAFDRARTLDPHDAKAWFYTGLAAEQDGRRDVAAGIWRDLLKEAPAGATWVDFVRQSLARVEPQPAPAGPTIDEVAAAEKLTPEQRSEMVRSMVGRLAAKLKQDGSDIEGWLRLVRAYTVLGDRDKARVAVSDAHRALANEPDKIRRLDELAKELGLEG